MTLRAHIKANLTLALPVMISNLGHVLMGLTDSVMIGHYSSLSLAAAGLATVVFNVFMLFGIGVSYAITPLVAAAHGEKNPEAITASVQHGIVINVFTSAVLILLVVAGKNALHHIGQPEEVVALSLPYLSIITYSLLPLAVFQSFKQFAEGLTHTRVAMFVMIGANVINVFLNYVLIYGHLGFPELGLKGTGWATLISRIVMALGIMAYIRVDRNFRLYQAVFSLPRYSKNLFNRMLHLGIPSGVQFIFEVAAFDFSLVMMGWFGSTVIAAHHISINMATISYMTTAGLAAAATVRVGYYLGGRDVHNLKAAAYSLLAMAVLVMSGWAVLFIAGREWLPSIYVDDPAVMEIATSLLAIAGLFQLADGAQVVCASALRGLHDVKIPSLFIFISYWILGLPLGYFIAFTWGVGPTGIWWGLLTGLTLTALAMFMRLRRLMNTIDNSLRIPEERNATR